MILYPLGTPLGHWTGGVTFTASSTRRVRIDRRRFFRNAAVFLLGWLKCA